LIASIRLCSKFVLNMFPRIPQGPPPPSYQHPPPYEDIVGPDDLASPLPSEMDVEVPGRSHLHNLYLHLMYYKPI
jgi:hypothetical protein